MTKILVTGATGFIASHLIEELLKNETNRIIGIDNFYSGTKDNLNYLRSIDKKSKFKFIEADIRNFDHINEIIQLNNVQYIYHLAAIVSVQESIQNPLLSHEVNVKGTLNILESSRLNKVKRLVFSSSAAVYGDEPTLPKNETSITKPISPYGCEKLICEQYMMLYNSLYDLETVVLRYFNVYGERQNITSDYSGVISIFDYKFKNNETPIIYGNGEQYRDFIYVKDIVKANIKAMHTPTSAGEIYCAGTGEKTSINELFTLMNKKYKRNNHPKYLDSRCGDIVASVCDNSKIKKGLELLKFEKFEIKVIKI